MDCYRIPATPTSLLLPLECVADVVAKPKITPLEEARANWMRGHANWQNQLLPVLSYSALNDSELDESKKRKAQLVILNPIPGAARKAHFGLICYGAVEKVTLDDSAEYTDFPSGVDRRYAEAAMTFAGTEYLVPRLAALAVAFSYF